MKRLAALRRLASVTISIVAVLVASDSRGDAQVPAQLQAQLVTRLATFDRNFQARAGDVAQILVVHRAGNADSAFEAESLVRALREFPSIAGLPATVDEAEFGDPVALAARCRAKHLAIVYFTVGLEGEMGRVAAAMNGVDVLTIGTTARHAENGAVVGFGLEESRPKIVLNLKQARAQNVNFKAELLKLARIVE